MDIRSPQNDAEREQAARLVAEAFRPQNTEAAMHYWLHALPRKPNYHPQYLRIVVVDHQVVSVLNIIDREIQVGRSRLWMGGIGAVVTAPAHRKHGYSSALLHSTVDFMIRRGFDLTALEGIPDYYHRFGYATVMPYRRAQFQVSETRALPTSLRVRPMATGDISALGALYTRDWGGRVGALVRDVARWRWYLERPGVGIVAVDAEDRVQGYATRNVHLGWVGEAAAVDANATAALLRHLAGQAHARGEAHFSVNLPADATFVRLARTLCPVEVIETSRPGAGWQARLLNIKSVFKKLSSELSARLSRATLAGWHGALRIETDIGATTLWVQEGQVQMGDQSGPALVCRLPQSRLAQLLFGYLSADQLATLPDAHVPSKAVPLLGALFPPAVAHIAGLDWF